MAQPIRIIIELADDQQGVRVNGPLNNPLIFYGMLDMARDACANYTLKMQASGGIIPATADQVPIPINRASRRARK